MYARFISSVNLIDSNTWNQVCGVDYPFLRHEFFSALENSGSTIAETGWGPHHLVIEDNEQIIGIMPLFIKTHSYGEYVFDWSWADAYHQHGIAYYPKLLSAIPFTPATGPRWGICDTVDHDYVLTFMLQSIVDQCEQQHYSSFHVLFTSTEDSRRLQTQSLATRTGCQYHWFNQDYQHFDDFLSTFNSRKRKNLKKERRKVTEQGISLTIKTGSEITAKDWDNFYLFYHMTYIKRSGREGYLTPEFFPMLATTMADQLVLIQAQQGDKAIAAALCFQSSDTLYGRYWGCQQEFDFLHFETCYYQGIEYAIEKNLAYFDPGAQGEHKIQRGFTPIKTYSNHWIGHLQFRDAVNRFLDNEHQHIDEHINEMHSLLPFKHSDN